MLHFVTHDLTNLLATYGYVAVLVFVGVESIGIPFPGETMLITAAIYAGTTHRLDITLVVAAAAAGAIVGDNIGYAIGRVGGYHLLRRYGRYIRLTHARLRLGQYLFRRHGGKVVFFGRWVSILRTFAAFLSGVNLMPWWRFLIFNASGGILWACFYGFSAYALGAQIQRLSTPFNVLLLAVAILVVAGFVLFMRANEGRLQAEADRTIAA
ncbi:MAG TPA: DedA family protein [Candidatus Limnocylindrales bacterium]|nr:DedA family protein [Candidatus Limnocylindrales bacterium]